MSDIAELDGRAQEFVRELITAGLSLVVDGDTDAPRAACDGVRYDVPAELAPDFAWLCLGYMAATVGALLGTLRVRGIDGRAYWQNFLLAEKKVAAAAAEDEEGG